MGRRWLSLEGISAPGERQYWPSGSVETCSTPIKIVCLQVASFQGLLVLFWFNV